jgi:hypothetical protein
VTICSRDALEHRSEWALSLNAVNDGAR